MRSLARFVLGSWVMLGLLGGAPAFVAGCGSEDDGTPQQQQPEEEAACQALFVVPDDLSELSGDHWLDHPWPSDLRRAADGSVRLEGYTNPRHVSIIRLYLEALRGKLDGFSPTAAGYVRFTAPIDPATLPATPTDTLSPDSSVQLLNVDPDSPDFGKRQLVTLEWHAEPTVYWPENTLGFMPTLGFPLRPSTTYALVVTDKIRSAEGGPVKPSDTLKHLLGDGDGSAALKALAARWNDAIDQVEKAGVEREHIVHLTVFTTGDPTATTIRVAEDAAKRQPAPKVDESTWKKLASRVSYDVYEGKYGPCPDYQAGKPPFQSAGDGGNFVFDKDGRPVVQRTYQARFALAIPHEDTCPMPADGYPVVMYAHGTGGDYHSFLGVTARSLAERCIASMGVDQIMHGDRLPKEPGKSWNVELLFFNFNNPDAMRTNIRQSAVDEVVRARLLRETGITIPASISVTGKPILLSKKKIFFFGHSQGGLNGPLFLAVDDTAKGAVLSGSGSMTVLSLLYKTKPDPSVSKLTKTLLLALRGNETKEVGPLHPGMALIQTIGDVVDPINYVPMLVRRPLPGHRPKSIYQTEGVNPDFTGDNYTPPYAIEVQAIATGLPWSKPVIHRIEEAKYTGQDPVEIPAGGLSGNLAGGKASGVLAQWPASEASDGHFVVFQIEGAVNQAAGFLESLVNDPVGKVPPR